jgi:hypothetical protein
MNMNHSFSPNDEALNEIHKLRQILYGKNGIFNKLNNINKELSHVNLKLQSLEKTIDDMELRLTDVVIQQNKPHITTQSVVCLGSAI